MSQHKNCLHYYPTPTQAKDGFSEANWHEGSFIKENIGFN